MTTRGLKLATTSFLAAGVILALAIIALMRISGGFAASVEHKGAKHTTATVVDVVEMEGRASGPESKGPLYKVCFTIDNFDQVDSGMRQGYRSAEARRLTNSGPRCKVTSNLGIARTLAKGGKLNVVYLLENDYQIDVVSAAAHGQDL